jgi:hypothetical protein
MEQRTPDVGRVTAGELVNECVTAPGEKAAVLAEKVSHTKAYIVCAGHRRGQVTA